MLGTARPIRLGLVGVGKIALDQHVPAIAADDHFDLVASATRNATLPGIPGYRDIASLLAADHGITAVSLCTPPTGRFDIAAAALMAGRHVMLEKPPGATVSEVQTLAALAKAQGVTLFTTWHSREAASVDAARAWLANATIRNVRIEWREDIRRWHPGQDWILAAGGFGVFDPGINALSIATAILPGPLRVSASVLHVPSNRAAPIAASLALVLGVDTPVHVEFDFLQTGVQSWDVVVETDRGVLTLSEGGNRLSIAGVEQPRQENAEYPRLYRRFADLIAAGESAVDLRPLQLVADAFLLARTVPAVAFDF